MYLVYKHTSPNNKIYIGITSKTAEERWRNRYRSNKHFSAAINKYGWENIKHEILFENLTKEEAETIEINLIKEYDSANPLKGYNIAKGGHSNSGFCHSEKSKSKIRDSLKGKKHTPKRRENESKALLKLWRNEEYKKKMAASHVGKSRGKENCFSKTLYQYSLENKLIKVFESVGEAERETGIDHRQISDCCNHKQKTCHGYVWSYELI